MSVPIVHEQCYFVSQVPKSASSGKVTAYSHTAVFETREEALLSHPPSIPLVAVLASQQLVDHLYSPATT